MVKDSLSKDDTIVVLDNLDGNRINWLLYKSTDLNNYVAYPNVENNLLKNSNNADAGLYYIYL
ncbi:MAG: hypothetical protein ACRDDM_11980 [Paraclostridium sp.]